MLDRRLVGWIAALALACAPFAAAQSPPPFAFVKDQIPAEAGFVLGLADFDQDGDLDLLTNGTGIYLNDGHGNFTPHPVLSAVSAGVANSGFGLLEPVAIGDLTGDSFPDVIAYDAGPTGAYLRKWINQGNGILIPSPLVPVGGSPSPSGLAYNYPIRAIALGDVDGDGDRDIVLSFIVWPSCGVGGVYYPPLALLLNQGTSAFVDASTQLPAPVMMPSQVALHDMDADGDLDLVCGGDTFGPTTGQIGPRIFLNNGAGTFSQTAIVLPATWNHDSFAIGDVDGDGLPDIALGRAPRTMEFAPTIGAPVVLRNLGAASFTALSAPSFGPTWCAPMLMDLDGNGSAELIALNYGSTTIHTISGNAVSAPIGSVATSIAPAIIPTYTNWDNVNHAAAGDLDGDGDPDLVVYTAQGNRVFFCDPAGQLVASPTTLAAPWTFFGCGPDAGDFDGDGDLDLVLSPYDCTPTLGPASITVALNDGTGTLTAGTPIPCNGVAPSVLFAPRAVLDVDQDGDLDLYVTGPASSPAPANTVHCVLLNNGGSFSLWQTLTHSGTVATTNLRAGDLDGDGDLDLVAAGSPVLVLLNSGPAGFQVAQALGSVNADVALVDVDADGDLDIVEPASNGSKLFLNGGSGSFTEATVFPGGPALSVAAGDLNGDGAPDLLLNNAVLLNNGAGVFWLAGSVPAPSNTPAGWSFYAVFDVDGDGLGDVIDTGGHFHRNLGGPAFATPVNLPVPIPLPIPFPIVHEDFDRDGDEDLLARGPAILTNMTRQLSRGKPARPGRPASLELAGPPGAPWLLFASNGTGNLPLPTLGTVFLDVPSAQLTHAGVFSAAGTATVSGTVPAGPAWVGASVFWQAIVYHPQGARLTGLEVTTIGNY